MQAQHAISLLIIALGAFFIPMLSRPIGIPAAVGEIIFGILAGPHLLGWIEPNEFTAFLAEFGFAFLMFLAGLELEFSRIKRQGWGGILTSTTVALLFFVVGLGFAWILDLQKVLFLVFGAASVGILLATLNEVGLSKSRAGQTMILVASTGEFLTIILLTGMDFYYRFGFGWQLVLDMAKLGVIFLAANLILIVLRTLIWWWPARFARMTESHDPSEIGVRASMATMLAFVALAAMMGLEAILGSFLAGVLFAFVFREKEVLQAKLSSLGFGFFVPIFFIWVGTEFNLPAVLRLDILPVLGILFGASVATKFVASLPLLSRGLRFRKVLGSSLLFGAPLTLLVVIDQVGIQVGVFDELMAGAIILLAIVTSVVLPWLFRWVMPRSNQDSQPPVSKPSPMAHKLRS